MTDFFALEQLASVLKQDLDTATATIARTTAQATIRQYCRQEITAATYTDVILPIGFEDGSWVVRVPQRPLTAITEVSVNGTTYVANVDYAWNGYSPLIRLARRIWSAATFQTEPVAVVSYTAGYATVPPIVTAIALAVALREYDNPTGVKSRQIDDYAESIGGAGQDVASLVALLPAEMRLLDDYRIRAASVVPQ